MKEGLLQVLLLFSTASIVSGDCPAGWTRNDDTCYYVSTSKYSYNDAAMQCGRSNGTLVTYASNNEWKFIVNLLTAGLRQNYWVGLRYQKANHSWTWVDGTPYTNATAHWYRNREVKPTTQSQLRYYLCAYTYGYLPNAGKVVMYNCRSSLAYVCKRSADTYDLCSEDTGWKDVNGKCYKFFETKATWDDARAICQQNNGDLYSPQNRAEVFLIGDLVDCKINTNNVWTGFSDRAVPGVYTSTTKQPMRYKAWAAYTTHIPQKGGSCLMAVASYYFYFGGDLCLAEHKFVCVKPYGTCPTGWTTQGNRCYKLNNAKTTWYLAEEFCRNQGTQLLVINSNDTQQFVQQFLLQNRLHDVWLGFSGQKSTNNLTWVDGTLVRAGNFTHWANHYPKPPLPDAHCGIITSGSRDAFWSNGYCHTSRAFICDVSMHRNINTTQPTPTGSLGCIHGWKRYGQDCYTMGYKPMNWANAQAFCKSYPHGDLTTIRSPYEQSFLLTQVIKRQTSWIGLKRDRTTSPPQFFWVDKTKVTYSNFYPGEPNDAGHNEDCTQVLSDWHRFPGSWNDIRCDRLATCVCRAPASDATQAPGLPPTVPWSYQCGPEWTFNHIDDYCYRIFTGEPKIWVNARADCRRRGGDLLSINGPKEQIQIQAILSTGQNALIQLPFWIGASDRNKEGGWEWSDGSPFRYLRWYPGEPNNQNAGEDCAEMRASMGYDWNDSMCNMKKNYICKKLAMPASTVAGPSQPTDSPTGNCKPQKMISGAYSLPDLSNALMTSTSRDPQHGPFQSRIFSRSKAWSAATNDVKQWIAASFYNVIVVHGIQIAGRPDNDEYVTSFKIQFQYDYFSPWYFFEDPPGTVKIFTANANSRSTVSINFRLPIEGKSIKLIPVAWHKGISLRWEIMGCIEEDCLAEYGVSGPLFVLDGGFTVSTTSDPNHSGNNARINPSATSPNVAPSCWRPSATDTNKFIAVDLGINKIIRGISTMGNPSASEWVTSYTLDYATSTPLGQSQYTWYQEPYGTTKIFNANKNSNTTVTNYLKSHISAKIVRIHPKSFHSYVALRFDILVCSMTCREIPLISGPHRVPDSQLTASSFLNSEHGPPRSRLNQPSQGDYAGGWEAEYTDQNQYIQVDLGRVVMVTAVATQGRSDKSQFVRQFKLSQSTDGISWAPYMSTSKTFNGNWDSNTVYKQYLPAPMNVHYVRLWPTDWQDRISMRWELYGCPGPMAGSKIGCFADVASARDLPYEPLIDHQLLWAPSCIHHCYLKGYFYAGLQAGYKCFCGNSYGKYGPGSNCSIACTPVHQQQCGGPSANLVYTTGLSDEKVCKTGWKSYNDNCYMPVSDRKVWSDARTYCKSKGADLLSIDDQHEQDFVYSLIAQGREDIWIGLNDLQREMFFEWSNLREVKFTNWNANQPRSSPGVNEDCVIMTFNTAGWQDENCNDQHKFICHAQKQPSQTPAQKPSVDGCRAGWDGYRWSCYLYVPQARSWSDASQGCSAFGATLVRIDDRYEQAYLASTLGSRSTYAWTDVTATAFPGKYLFSDGKTSATVTNWAANKPDQNGPCVALGTGQNAGLWYNTFCNNTYPAICEYLRTGYTRPPTSPPTTKPPACPTGWTSSTHYCYQINAPAANLQRGWQDARTDCLKQGVDLASFHDPAVLDDIWRNHIVGMSNHFWVGLNNLKSGTLTGYTWSDNSPVEFTHWNSGEPNNQNGKEQCGELLVDKGSFNDEICSSRRNWICGMSRGHMPSPRTPMPIPTAGPPGSCSPKNDLWKSFNGHCYYVNEGIGDDALTWRGARDWCGKQGAHLVSIMSMQEQLFVQSLVANTTAVSVWIGLNELDWDWGYRWSDGEASASFLYWNSHEPNDYLGSESCVEMIAANGRWNDEHCASRRGFACKANVGNIVPTQGTPSPAINGNCPAGFNAYGNKCYRLYGINPSDRMNWMAARARCTSLGRGYDLASITNLREQAFVTTLLTDVSFSAWIGITKRGNVLVWIDNSEMTYTNYAHGEPNDAEGKENCVQILSSTQQAGLWNDNDCSKSFGYICQTLKKPFITTPEPIPNPCDGKMGFQPLGQDCIKVISTPMNWTTARSYCNPLGAKLASINNVYENAFMIVLATQNSSNSPLWIGLNDIQKTGHYVWVDSWPVLFTRWSVGEPSHSANEGCVLFYSDGTWADDQCSKLLRFACKISSANPPYTPAPPNGTCPGSDWEAHGQKCYRFRPTERISYPKAVFQCNEWSAELVSIHDNATNNYLWYRIQSATVQSIWLGLYGSQHVGMNWRDNTPLQFSNWGPGEPSGTDSSGAEEHCGEMYASNGHWNDLDCLAERGYVCERSQIYDTKVQTFPPNLSKAAVISPGIPTPPTPPHKPTPPYNPTPPTAPHNPTPPVPSQNPTGKQSSTAKPTGKTLMQSDSGGAVGPGGIAGITLGVILALLIAAILVFFFVQRRRPNYNMSGSGEGTSFDNHLYETKLSESET